MLKALNLGSLRSSSVSISGNGPPKLGAGWGSEVSTWMVTRLSARGEKGAVDVVAGVLVTDRGVKIRVGRWPWPDLCDVA